MLVYVTCLCMYWCVCVCVQSCIYRLHACECVSLCVSELTCVFGEVVGQVGEHDLLLQDVCLVEEQDDGGLLEPGVGDDGLKQRFALLHPVLRDRGTERMTGWREREEISP